jgi:DNA sulfur modification protein DndD
MRFHSIRLKNWRCFLGEVAILFANQDSENVTILIGQNGSGKTAFLNAFTWGLFCETTAGFRKPQDLFNHAALAAILPTESARMEVLIEFEHEGSHYEIKRYQIAERTSSSAEPKVGEPKLAASRRKDGATEKIEQGDIEKILPHGLHSFFFFPAESIGKELDHGDGGTIRASMARAIDVLLGIDRYDRAVQVVSEALSKHLKAPLGLSSTAVDDAQVEMEAARDSWVQLAKRKKELPDIIRQSKELENSFSEQLEKLEAYQEFKDTLDKLEGDLKQAQIKAKAARHDQSELVNSHACVVFGGELFSDASNALEKAHRAGEIPPKISAGLLRELIEDRDKCICGADLGPEELEHLKRLRAETVSDQVVDIASNLRGRITSWFTDSWAPLDKTTGTKLLGYVRQAADADNDVRRLTNKQQELMSKVPAGSHASQAGTMEAWQKAVTKTKELEKELSLAAEKLPKLEGEKSDAEKKHQKLLQKDSKTRSVGRAREYLSKVESVLTDIQDIIRNSARQDVQRAMNLFFQPLLLKDYEIGLTEEFKYQVIDSSTGKSVGASSSEIALATFAFVGAVASLMPAYANIESLIPRGDRNSPGGITPNLQEAYPVVLDAPYSPFGEEYSERFSHKLPDLLPQSVIIIREDQIKYLKPMLSACRIGRAYVLQMHSGKEAGKRISWQGREVDYVINTGDEESPRTEIVSLSVE